MDLTRRALIRRAAAASSALAGASLLGPRVVFAGVDGEEVIELAARPGTIETKRPFEMLGVESAAGRIRTRALNGRWSEWFDLRPGHEGAALSEPIWTGPSDAFELRSVRRGARVVLVAGGQGARAAAAAVKYVDSGLAAGPGQPRIIARSSWATASCRPRVQPELGALDVAFVHHTVNSNFYRPSDSASMVRSICLFHKYGNGWDDIGYNFVVDRFGQVFEGRQGGIDEAIVGAQAGGYNAHSSGIALLGNFTSSGPPRKTFDSLARLLAWKLTLHGTPVTGRTRITVTKTGQAYSRYRAGTQVELARISGHRDADTTTCPGDAMYRQLPRLRQVVSRLSGSASQLSLALQAVAPGGATLAGALTNDRAPIAGATVELQQRRVSRGAVTLVTAVTNPDGTWAATVPLSQATALRALYRGDGVSPAVISPGLVVAVPPSVSLAAATQRTAPGGVIAFSGSVSPRKAKVTLVVAQQQPDGSFATVRSVRVSTAEDGSFGRGIGFPAAGNYEVIAHTSADDRNSLGTSAPVSIAVA